MTKQIRALTRGLIVVKAINDAKGPLGLQDLHRRTGIDKATLLRILATLEAQNWVYRGMSDNLYYLSYLMHDLGMHVGVYNAIAEASAPVLERLQQCFPWPSDICVYNGDRMAVIETSRRHAAFVPNYRLPRYRPPMLRSAVGRVYFAYSDERRRRTILEHLRGTATGGELALANDEPRLAELIATVLAQGYALRDEVLNQFAGETEKVGAIAVPVLVKEEIQACVNILWPVSVLSETDAVTHFLPALQQAAGELAVLFLEHGIY